MLKNLAAQTFTENVAEIVVAYVSNNSVSSSELPGAVLNTDEVS